MITLQQMEYIIAIDRYKSIQKAADKCFVSQPAMSMQLKKAEEDLGLIFFDRRKHPLEATDLSRKVIDQMKVVFEEAKRINKIIDKDNEVLKGEIKIGVIPTVANYLINDLYQINYSKLQDVTFNVFELKTNEVVDALKNKEIDLGIISGPFNSHLYESVSLFYEPILIYGKNHNQGFFVDNLDRYTPWLLKEGNCLRNQMVNFCELRDVENSKLKYEGNSLQTLIDLIELGQGFTLLPELSQDHLKLVEENIYEFKNSIPARNIISLSQKRNANRDIIEVINNEIKNLRIRYSELRSSYELVEWD